MKKFSIVLLALSLVTMITACSSSKAPSNEIIMATEAGFAPYEYYEGDKIVGVDVDIANEIAKAMGKTLKIVDMDFGAIPTAISTGKATFGAAGMSITPERLETVDFSVEYAVSEQVILVKNDSTITKAEDLNGKNVGAQLGTVADFYLSDSMPDVKAKQYVKYADAASDILGGRLDAMVMDLLPAQAMVKAHPELKILEESLFTDKYALAVKKGDKETLAVINSTLEKLINDGKITEYTLNHTTNKK